MWSLKGKEDFKVMVSLPETLLVLLGMFNKKMFRLALAATISLVYFIAGPYFSKGGLLAQNMMGADKDLVDAKEKNLDLDRVLEEVLTKYGKSKIQELECSELTDEDFERIGDAYMESIHPGEAHEVMDRMMGGEGSEALRSMHIRMGRGYLGCIGNWEGKFGAFNFGMPMMSFMGRNMMGDRWYPFSFNLKDPFLLFGMF